MDKEYRIPITVELIGDNKAKVSNTMQPLQPVSNQPMQPSVLSSASMISMVGTTMSFARQANKLISASGNTKYAKGVELGGKAAGVLVTALSGNIPLAIGQASLEIAEIVLKEITKARQEAQKDNQTLINNIRLGQQILGSSNIKVSKNIWGKISYTAN